VLLGAAFATAAIGIHPAFGAFAVGSIAPRTAVVARLRAWLTPAATILLLPVFFTFAGLHTSVGLLLTPSLLGLTVLVTAVAFASKLGACYAAARLVGRDSAEALAIGSLMNARGLVEIIVLTIGLQRGLITTRLFSIMFLIAIVSTLAAPWVLRGLRGRLPRADLNGGTDQAAS